MLTSWTSHSLGKPVLTTWSISMVGSGGTNDHSSQLQFSKEKTFFTLNDDIKVQVLLHIPYSHLRRFSEQFLYLISYIFEERDKEK